MSQRTETETLTRYTDLMNELLPVIHFMEFNVPTLICLQAYDISGDSQPSVEARQSLLRDARSVRDTYTQDRMRLENQILAAQQTLHALTTELGIADQKLASFEDLIGEVRMRMQSRGLPTYPPTVRRQLPRTTAPAAVDNMTNPPSACKSSRPLFSEFTLLTNLQPASRRVLEFSHSYNSPPDPQIMPGLVDIPHVPSALDI